ncbi:hypothetical protein MAMC_01042 [Methylacidimicrobium cyclopophantes]|uniref:UDP-N-acetyl-alpha-D-muramoyl-L-alanyl-L-glutamate epimerase n=1 Tax=Methylacidimicrobium cyclopophantes TaxID=1041766 RepID=A0A5E6MAU9_9BACT|nr:hypothetical protein [Methylacidimicrobium cyclopophantes]VVM06338.1 hypothetical protein MAMC_01042 [Methylacidimicrobium cyclopophantes]
MAEDSGKGWRRAALLCYEGFRYQIHERRLSVAFSFRLDDSLTFRPRASFPVAPPLPSKEALDLLVFSLGLIELVSYWKAACPPRIRVEAGSLAPEQIAWWKRLYFRGLGEFFYRNGIAADEAEFVEMRAAEGRPFPSFRGRDSTGALVPVGGGKDSFVTLELLRGREGVTPFLLNSSREQKETVALFGFPASNTALVRRTIDPSLLELNRRGYWNGHTPFSALLAFAAFLAAVTLGKRWIVLSNEASADEPTVLGSQINHQYSKSFAFERDFADYAARWLTPSVGYFSLLRPWNELQIAERFVRIPGALDRFRSCSSPGRSWCGRCAKCLFVSLILSPFVEKRRLDALFGRDLLEDSSLAPLFFSLLGGERAKPFACVGTTAESRAAAAALARRPNPPLLVRLARERGLLPGSAGPSIEDLLTSWNSGHGVPPDFLPLLATPRSIALSA